MDGAPAAPGAGVGCGSSGRFEFGSVEERIKGCHLLAHVVGPFEYLWSDVDEEGIGGPPPEDHDAGGGDIVEEQGHRGSRADGFVSDFVCVEAEPLFTTV